MNTDDENFLVDVSHYQLKPDHASRPLWVAPYITKEGDVNSVLVILEAFNPIYKQAYDFLIAIAEPLSRPQFFHEYKLTRQSLYSAVSVGLDANAILNVLEKLNKTKIDLPVVAFIKSATEAYGKVAMVLRNKEYFVESTEKELIEKLASDPIILDCMPHNSEVQQTYMSQDRVHIAGTVANNVKADKLTADLDEEDDDTSKAVYYFKVFADRYTDVKARAQAMNYPLLEEYEFKNDPNLGDLGIRLKAQTVIRPYQDKSLGKMFGSGRARSGIIVLPCGAGKTLVGVTACITINKPSVILCTSSLAVDQWYNQFKMWTTATDEHLTRFTAEKKEPGPVKPIVITTYSMLAALTNRGAESSRILEEIKNRTWGSLILDEVQVAPATRFSDICRKIVTSHCKLGLTATLVREDDKIKDLSTLVGPKLYEANWIDLRNKGYIANVLCQEVRCPMPALFYEAYLNPPKDGRSREADVRNRVAASNPTKIRITQMLVRYHEERGDKVLVFSNDIAALKEYCHALKREAIHGETNAAKRHQLLQKFREHKGGVTLIMSKIGDNSLDLPSANVLIQVSAHYASRRQEAQRLGRILRPKEHIIDASIRSSAHKANAFFYSLVSVDTKDTLYSAKRRSFLVDQGYAFSICTDLAKKAELEGPKLDYWYKEDQKSLLTRMLAAEPRDETGGPDDATETDENEEAKRQNYLNQLGTQLSSMSSDLYTSTAVSYTAVNKKKTGSIRARAPSGRSALKALK